MLIFSLYVMTITNTCMCVRPRNLCASSYFFPITAEFLLVLCAVFSM